MNMKEIFELIPWRIRNIISDRYPLLYHSIVNFGQEGNSAKYWDERLKETWDDKSRDWPVKNNIIHKQTSLNDSILDVACGNGGTLRYLKEKGYINLAGLEISDYAVSRLRSDDITMYHGSLPGIPIEDNRFEVVIASQVLEHIIQRDKFIEEIHRVLKPKGRAFIFVPDDCLGPIDEPEHVIKYTNSMLYEFLTKYFSRVEIQSIEDTNHEISILYAKAEK